MWLKALLLPFLRWIRFEQGVSCSILHWAPNSVANPGRGAQGRPSRLQPPDFPGWMKELWNRATAPQPPLPSPSILWLHQGPGAHTPTYAHTSIAVLTEAHAFSHARVCSHGNS